VVPPVSIDRAAFLEIVAQGAVDRDGRSCSAQAPELPGQTDHEQHEQSEVENLEDPRVRARDEGRARRQPGQRLGHRRDAEQEQGNPVADRLDARRGATERAGPAGDEGQDERRQREDAGDVRRADRAVAEDRQPGGTWPRGTRCRRARRRSSRRLCPRGPARPRPRRRPPRSTAYGRFQVASGSSRSPAIGSAGSPSPRTARVSCGSGHGRGFPGRRVGRSRGTARGAPRPRSSG
jgi:hypothetical protein